MSLVASSGLIVSQGAPGVPLFSAMETTTPLVTDLLGGENISTENPYFYGMGDEMEDGKNVFFFKTPEDMLNPSKRNPAFYPIVITHAITFVLGIIGNVVAVSVMIGDRKGRNATNLFLVSLAVADLLLLLLCIPLEVLQYFLQFEDNGVICKVARYTELLSASASVLNLCAVSFERFIVIVFPMRSRSVCTLSNCRKALCFVWTFAIGLSLPVLLTKEGYSVTYTNNITSVSVFYCEEESVSEGLPIAIYKFVILFAAPALLMMICYIYVIRELWKSTKNMNILTNSKSIRASEKKVNNVVMDKSPTSGQQKHPVNQTVHTTRCSQKIKCTVSGAAPVPGAVEEKNLQINGHNHNLAPQNNMNMNKSKDLLKPGNTNSTVNQRRALNQVTRTHKGEDAKKARKQVIKMLILIIILFLICWGPKLILNITLKLALIFGYPIYSQEVYVCRVAFSLIPFVHSCINPIVYSFMSKNFRRSMNRQLGRCCVVCGCKCQCNNCGAHRNSIPLRTTARARTTQVVESTYSSNYCQLSDMHSTRHTEVEGISTI
ncbi:unnamed protein product [Orchesella dallaii]|uniref:G-protein coupled receptors family 1 profile domain-containing protein n=1 Tax=Orchesella dallaii TaxID=48710 RepID=A0ABP1QIY3_9HEXA